MSITSVTTLDGHTVDVTGLSESEQLYCLILASGDPQTYDGDSAWNCLIGRAGTVLPQPDEDMPPASVVLYYFPDLAPDIYAIYSEVTYPKLNRDFQAAIYFAARRLNIPPDRADQLRNQVIGSAS